MNLAGAELSIILTDDKAIRQLNREFRGKDTPTDVLSFPQNDEGVKAASAQSDHESSPPVALGDIAISLDTTSRQAKPLRQTEAERLRTLLIHGLLHLLGYDHERSPAEARRMFARERELAATVEARRNARRSTQAGRPVRTVPTNRAGARS
jgi:probable rRNA maturation factor